MLAHQLNSVCCVHRAERKYLINAIIGRAIGLDIENDIPMFV